MKKAFRTCWAIYGLTVFFLMWVVFMPFYFLGFALLPKPWRKIIFWFSHHVYTRIFFTLTLIRIQVEGLEHLDPQQRYIIVSNHLTPIDFMVNARAFPGIYKFLAKRELVKVPLFGYIVRKMCVLVDRRDARSRAQSIQFLKQTLEEGYSVFVYPEGTRNRSSEPLLPFHKGAFRIAIESGVPVAIQTITDIRKVCASAEGLDLSPGTVKVVWSKPIPVEGMTERDVNTLAEMVRSEMLSKLRPSR
ncbi:MAG: hypothetical protein KatS3mg029_0321 [Saprospiraceae bacterium]|nr:MAG: hypothetical protein KatS3mg029_0321 [Saprospiraceae bacterium]